MCIPLLSLLSEIVDSSTLDVGAAARAPFHGASSQFQGSRGRFYRGSGGE